MRKILSLDGGGIKGVFIASFLATIEESCGVSIADYFDLIVGTSTGGIIALGLGMGFTAKEILAFYEDNGVDIFKTDFLMHKLLSFFFSKYKNDKLKNALVAKFGDKMLGESKKRLVIPSLNIETGEVYIYKTSHHERLGRDYKEKVIDIAMATTAAPTYFPTHISSTGIPLVDGGIWANNPVGVAVVEAIGVLEWRKKDIKVLSISCTGEPLSIKLGRKVGLGKGYYALKGVEMFMKAQSSASQGIASILIGAENIERIEPIISKGRFSLDNIKEIKSLKGLGSSEARKALPKIKKIFLQKKAEEFTPFNRVA